MGGEWHQQPPIGLENLSSIRRRQQSTHPFGEETKTRCLRIKKKSEIKEPGIEIPFICLENHWFIHEVLLGWFQPHTVVAWHWDFQTWGMMRQSHWYRDHYGTAFSSLKYLSYHRAQNCKKVIETIKHDQHRYSTKCHLMFQQRLFLLVIFWKQGLLKCFMTRSPFFPPS